MRESRSRWQISRATKWALLLVLAGGCSAGKLERIDEAPLTDDLADRYNAEAKDSHGNSTPGPPPPVYTRYDLGKLSIVNLGIVVDVSIVPLRGTSDTGWKVGTAAGAMNSLNSGTTSTESIVLRVLGGALVGATIESTLTEGQTFEYIIKRDDGKLISTLNRSRLSVGDCLMIRTDPSNSRTFLEVKKAALCATIVSGAKAKNMHSHESIDTTGSGQSQLESESPPRAEHENGNQLVGRWCDKQIPSMPKYNGILKIVITDSGSAQIHMRYGDGSTGTSALTKLDGETFAVVNSNSGDIYRIVPSDGNLELLDNEGLIRVAKRLGDNVHQGECSL